MNIYKHPPLSYIQNGKKNKSPIILLTGLTLKWGFLKQLGDKLSYLGYPIYVVEKLGSNILTIPESAGYIKEIIDKNDLRNVIIIGHSKGGLVGKYLLVNNNSDNRIKKEIALAAPFLGTTLAAFIPVESFKEVLPTSPVIKELNRHTDINKYIISIYPSFDNHIWPQGGSILQGARNIKMDVKGHHKIVFDKKTQEKIIDCIEKL